MRYLDISNNQIEVSVNICFKKRREDPTERIKRLLLRCIYFVKSKFLHHQQLVKIIELQKKYEGVSVLKWKITTQVVLKKMQLAISIHPLRERASII